MVHTLEEHQLPVGPFGVGLVLKGPAQLLHRDRNSQNHVQGRAGGRMETDGTHITLYCTRMLEMQFTGEDRIKL